MASLRIFSYLPSPRVCKATIAARLCGVEIELRGASPSELRNWLWDYDARPIGEDEKAKLASSRRTGRIGMKGQELFKTDAFLSAHPFGTVPAAFGPDGEIGIFESNSIMRAVARLGEQNCALYGRDPYEASRIDSFLDASLVFARETQVYLLALSGDALTVEIHAKATEAFVAYADALERTLGSGRHYLVGETVTIADICFAAELALLMGERRMVERLGTRGLYPILHGHISEQYPRVMSHFDRLVDHPAFKPDLEPYLRRPSAKTPPSDTPKRGLSQ
jgi:glutathione S-transferase